MILSPAEAIQAHKIVTSDSMVDAANWCAHLVDHKEKFTEPKKAQQFLFGLYILLLDNNLFTEAALLQWGIEMFDPRPRSVQRIWNGLMNYSRVLIPGSGAQGKCWGKGTKVIMFDGSLRSVEDVKVGDFLMGDDSSPRKVLSTTSGVGQLYRINPVKGESWVCNSDHILSLKCSANKKGRYGKISHRLTKGRILDIPIEDYLASSESFRQHYKQYKCGLIGFPEDNELPIDPYIFGLWLGDGHTGSIALTNVDEILIDTWCSYFQNLGYSIRNDGISYFVTRNGEPSPLRQYLRSLDGKRIPKEFLINSEGNRLKVLAGIIDTDGWGQDCGYGVTTKSEALKDGICFLANSLGFCATWWKSIKRCQNGFEGEYYTIRISGNCERIPTKLKKYQKRKHSGDPLLTYIRVEGLGDGEYYGFTLDGNHRCLLHDFTVMHNSFTPAAWSVLWWTHDPRYTSVKVISVTASHAAANLLSTIKLFHSSAAIKLPGRVMHLSIDNGDGDDRSSIQQVALPTGTDIKGRLRGFHPVLRPYHRLFGHKTRVAALIDEGEDAPHGVWEGIDNMLSTETSDGIHIKVVSGTNPKKRESPFAQRCEYPGGWQNFDLETSEEWDGPEALGKWRVIRLDAAKSENVLQKKEVFPGMMTYEGYTSYLRKGTNAPDYYCVDTETELLSKRGWLGHSEVKLGDEIYTININTGMAEWQPVDEIFKKPYHGDMTSVQGIGIDAIVTPGHKWPTTYKNRKTPEFTIKATESLAKHDLIPVSRDSKDYSGENDKDFASLLGWIVTEGSYQKSDGRRIRIYQSNTYNPEKCEIIRSLLNKMGAGHSEYHDKSGITHFCFSGELAQRVRSTMPGKKLSMSILESFDRQSMQAMLDAIILGDGGLQGGGTKYACVNDLEQAELYAALMIRCGHGARIHARTIPYTYRGVTDYRLQYYVNQVKRKFSRVQYLNINKCHYNGIAWCPKTKNQTFLAKRHGRIYFTGNTFGRGAWPESSAEFHITPTDFFFDCQGTIVFSTDVISIASLDPAFAEGGDKPMLTTARYGTAIGFVRPNGKYEPWSPPRKAIQIEQQFQIKKDNSVPMAEEVITYLRHLKIRPEWFIMDKMQPISEPVLTPSGWVNIGKLKTGDSVIGSDGKPTEVLGVYPQKDKRVMKVTCSDGAWTRCGPEHLWIIQNSRNKRFYKVTTEQLEALIMKQNSVRRGQRQWIIPLIGNPVQFNKVAISHVIDPYLMGILLGDGNLRLDGGIRFSSSDQEIVDSVIRLLPKGLSIAKVSKYDYTISRTSRKIENLILSETRRLGISGLKSHDKFIPNEYLLSDPQSRLAILQGLMDTDGCAGNINNSQFISTSRRLIQGVSELVQSLGGVAREAQVTPYRFDPRLNKGKGCHCKESYKITIQLPDSLNPFRLKRKAGRISPRSKRKLNRYVKSVEWDTDEESVCIKVASEDQLYVTRGYLLTHNTGVGWGLHDIIQQTYGQIHGQIWGDGVTNTKILLEDTGMPEDRYSGVNTEMMFAFSAWLQYKYIKFAPMMDYSPIFNQAIGRTYYFTKKGALAAQDKAGYKISAGNQSPDEYDSAIMLVHLVRKMEAEKAAALPPPPPPQILPFPTEQLNSQHLHGVIDTVEFYNT